MHAPLPRPPATGTVTVTESAFLARLADDQPLVTVELRPPRADLPRDRSIDTWIDMHHGVRRLVNSLDTFVFLTDNAVGQNEEENLHHLHSNLAQDVSPARLVPFLTCKHSLDYCLRYAQRAASTGYEALTGLGGDHGVGAPRCVPHAYELRRRIRERVPRLALGGWANPHREPERQVEFLAEEGFSAEYFLTQVVSHHDLRQVEAFLDAFTKSGLQLPALFGVFFYRSARKKTLQRLSQFLPVPTEGLTQDFAAGRTPEQICAQTIRELRSLGIGNVYVSNVEFERAPQRMRRILDQV